MARSRKTTTNKSKPTSSAKRTSRNNLSASRTRKKLTPNQKLTFHLNEALAIENAAGTKTPITNKTDQNRQCKTTTSASPRGDKRTTE